MLLDNINDHNRDMPKIDTTIKKTISSYSITFKIPQKNFNILSIKSKLFKFHERNRRLRSLSGH